MKKTNFPFQLIFKTIRIRLKYSKIYILDQKYLRRKNFIRRRSTVRKKKKDVDQFFRQMHQNVSQKMNRIDMKCESNLYPSETKFSIIFFSSNFVSIFVHFLIENFLVIEHILFPVDMLQQKYFFT